MMTGKSDAAERVPEKFVPVTKLVQEPQNQRQRAGRAKRWTKPKGMPKRPLSAYNLFFAEERRRLIGLATAAAKGKLSNRNSSHQSSSKLGFAGLARAVAASWKNIDPATKAMYQQRSEEGREIYKKEVKEWEEKLHWYYNNASSRSGSSSDSAGRNSEAHTSTAAANTMHATPAYSDTNTPLQNVFTSPSPRQERLSNQEEQLNLRPCEMTPSYPKATRRDQESELFSVATPSVSNNADNPMAVVLGKTWSSGGVEDTHSSLRFPNYDCLHDATGRISHADRTPTNPGVPTQTKSHQRGTATSRVHLDGHDDATAEDYIYDQKLQQAGCSSASCLRTEHLRPEKDPAFEPLRIFPEQNVFIAKDFFGFPQHQPGRVDSTSGQQANQQLFWTSERMMNDPEAAIITDSNNITAATAAHHGGSYHHSDDPRHY